jgi:hypothetical protein
MNPDTPTPNPDAQAQLAEEPTSVNSTTLPPIPRITLRQDSHGRLFRLDRAGLRRCDESGTPLTRLRLPKKLKLKLRRAGVPATKWIQSRPTE